MITPTQHEVFSFIHERIKSTGFAPSYQEIADSLKSRSTSSIHRLIVELEKRGYLTRSPGRARGIKLLQVPVNSTELLADWSAIRKPVEKAARESLISDTHHGKDSSRPTNQKLAPRISESDSLPETPRGRLHAEILLTILGRDDHFSMVADDDAMNRDGILHGDTVIVHRCDKASSGSIVAVALEGRTTLRRMVSRGKRISLESSDTRQEMLILPADKLRIQGKMVVLIREC